MPRSKHGRKCIICNKDMERHAKRFCSTKCQNTERYNVYIKNWKLGLESGQMCQSVSGHIKRYLREKYNNKCSQCGWCKLNIYTKKIPIQVEHIDGNYQNCKEENLTLLCPNCHSLTPTYGGANKGNGRKERYANR